MKIHPSDDNFSELRYIRRESSIAAKLQENGKILGKSDFCGRSRKFFSCFLQFPLAFAGPLADTSPNTPAPLNSFWSAYLGQVFFALTESLFRTFGRCHYE